MKKTIHRPPANQPVLANAQPRRVLGAAILSDWDWHAIARNLRLSGREMQIVRGVFNNRTEHAIAADEGIADCTVHTHIERLYNKLGVSTRVELVLRVMETFLDPKPRTPCAGEPRPRSLSSLASSRRCVL
ncbi:MAG: helix-turn-helix transcriptional regulator [Nitrospira sp.]|nr:helix-turn-helix transcriptional regulator [Nitrospira sp.]